MFQRLTFFVVVAVFNYKHFRQNESRFKMPARKQLCLSIRLSCMEAHSEEQGSIRRSQS